MLRRGRERGWRAPRSAVSAFVARMAASPLPPCPAPVLPLVAPGHLTMVSHHCERALIPSLPHLKDSSGCGLWCAVCAVCAECALCARVCLSVALRFES